MKRILAVLALCLLIVGVVSATYTDAIGFQWDTASDSPALTRVFANGTVASVGGDYFNNHAIWGNIKKVLVNRTTGAVTYGSNNRGDGLDLTGAGGNQVMVEIPMFYSFESYVGTKHTMIVSPTQYNSSFAIHPLFYQRGDGTPSAHYYVGAYEMQTESIGGVTTGTSYTGKTPVVSQTIGTMRTYAEANGARWGLMNIWTWTGLRELLYIETGTLNSQIAWSKSRGVVDGTWTGVWDGKIAGADSADTNTFAVNATGGGTGTNGLTPVVYRGVQDLWGNDWEFIDGQNSYTSGGNSIWHNINRSGLNTTGGQTKFQDLLITTDYESSTTTTIADGYQTAIATGAADRLLMIPTSVGGSETTYLADYHWYPRSTSSSTPNILLAGGYWGFAGSAGAGAWRSPDDASYSNAFIGARLEFRPSIQTVSFSVTPSIGVNPLTVSLNDTTTSGSTITSYNASFGDGSWLNQTTFPATNITHLYSTAGNYTVDWYVSNAQGTFSASTTITVWGAVHSAFSMFNAAGTAPHTTYLYDTSTNLTPGSVTYLTDFGEGNTSTLANTYFTWNATGTYNVTHTVSNGLSSETSFTTVTVGTPTPPVVAPVASFYGSPTTGNVPLTVSFTDVSSNTPTSWNWSFGDGIYSELQNPTHAYNRSGFKNVALTATNSAGSNITVRAKFVRVS